MRPRIAVFAAAAVAASLLVIVPAVEAQYIYRGQQTSCPPGTRPVAGADNCVPSREGGSRPIRVGAALVGLWSQSESSGGPCPTCTLQIAFAGRAMSVRSSNGWSAQVDAGSDGDDGRATGSGRWVQGDGRFSGRPVTVELDMAGRNSLRMLLAIRNADGSTATVRAGFVRQTP